MSVLWFGFMLFGILSVAFTVYALVMIGRCSCLGELSDPGSTIPSERNCVVCLAEFEDEEYVRQLSMCRHSFHAPCIDMWLYSHSDCPLCRTPIHRLDSEDGASTSELGTGSMDGLLDIRISS